MKMSVEGTVIHIDLLPQEAELLGSLVTQTILLMQDYSPLPLDDNPVLAALDIGGSSDLPDDPALARLFPDAYEDAEQSQEFRQLVEQGLINRKLVDAATVSNALTEARAHAYLQGRGEDFDGDLDEAAQDGHEQRVSVSPEHFEAWIRTLNTVRLAVAARVDITSVEVHQVKLHDPETRPTVLVYDWLGVLLEGFIELRGEEMLGK